jgi:hypothetical protein
MEKERIWVFLLSRALRADEMIVFTQNCQHFVSQWTAHEKKLSASFEMLGKQMLIVRVNEALYAAIGCSIDKLTHFIKSQEKAFEMELLNRLFVAYEGKEQSIEVAHVDIIKNMLAQGQLNEFSKIYDTSISSSDQMESWKQNLKDTWLKKYLSPALK